MDALGLDYRKVDPADPGLADLIAHHAAHGDAHYPAESNHHQDGNALAKEGVVLFVGFRDGAAVAMGGYKIIAPAEGEVKSMHVTEGARGQGAGAHLLGMIVDHARAAGLHRLSLETGSLEGSAAARRLYEKAGFTYCPPFGAYAEDPMSVFMTRTL
jgi:putative acetyltransferase